MNKSYYNTSAIFHLEDNSIIISIDFNVSVRNIQVYINFIKITNDEITDINNLTLPNKYYSENITITLFPSDYIDENFEQIIAQIIALGGKYQHH